MRIACQITCESDILLKEKRKAVWLMRRCDDAVFLFGK
nr:MAG TPA: hypothetical protein [Caudoviricetes sp.]